MNITIKDVAKAANVSVATVSRVLNKKSNVSDEAVQAVNKARIWGTLRTSSGATSGRARQSGYSR